MANGVNSVHVLGNLGRDPELRHTQNGTAVCNLSLAVNESRKVGDEWKEHVEWVRVVVFGKTAENCAKYLAKGKQAYVEGRMQTTKYTDKQGAEKYSTEVVANNVVFLGGGSGKGGEFSTSKPASAAAKDSAEPEFYDDDLPF